MVITFSRDSYSRISSYLVVPRPRNPSRISGTYVHIEEFLSSQDSLLTPPVGVEVWKSPYQVHTDLNTVPQVLKEFTSSNYRVVCPHTERIH
jgi:hypothetical protein